MMHLQGTHLRENMKCDTGFLPYRFFIVLKTEQKLQNKTSTVYKRFTSFVFPCALVPPVRTCALKDPQGAGDV